MFANPQVPSAAIPTADAVDWEPLHPRYARRLQAGALIRFGVLALVLTAVHILLRLAAAHVLRLGGPELLAEIAIWSPRFLWTAFGFFAARALVWPVVAVPRCGYAVRERDVLYRSGVLWRRASLVPFNRVQHTQVASGLLDRRFGLASLTVYAAGSGGLTIPGLGAGTAEDLRAYATERIQAETLDAANDDC